MIAGIAVDRNVPSSKLFIILSFSLACALILSAGAIMIILAESIQINLIIIAYFSIHGPAKLLNIYIHQCSFFLCDL